VPRVRPRAAAAAVALLAGMLVPCTLPAQHDTPRPAPGARPPVPDVPRPGVTRLVEGEVVRATAGGDRTVPREWVTLHRVARDGAGPVDSTRTDDRGRYRFRYAAGDTSDAMYIVSIQYGGIAYFSSPLHHEEVRGDESRLTVFDTTSGPLPIHVRGRHVVVSGADPDGRRTVFEVFELSNDSTLTLVATDSSAFTFATLLPDAADAPSVTQGDIAAGAVRFREGRAEVLAPIAPGLRQLAIRYALPASAFPLSIPVENGAEVLEVLLEERLGTATGARLAAADSVLVEGRRFYRYLAQDVPARAVATIAVPTAGTVGKDRAILLLVVVLGAAMFAVFLVVLLRRPAPAHASAPAGVAAPPDTSSPDADSPRAD
jgi:hypothetical protein